MGRYFVELFPENQPVPYQLPERVSEHGVRNAGQRLFQLAIADFLMDAELVQNLRFPLALNHPQQKGDRAFSFLCRDSASYPLQIFLIGRVAIFFT